MERNALSLIGVHMTGIGGIGMSALAQYLADHGVRVTGSDRSETPVTAMLARKGIEVTIGHAPENVPEDAQVLVYSDAVPEDNVERIRARELGIDQLSCFAMLGKVSAGKRTVAVAGTHGKTTTTGMLTRILRDAHASPTAIVGSIVQDFGSNYLPGESDLFVVEACEHLRHFLNLAPSILVVTNIEWDHTDYYRDLADFQSAFSELMQKVPKDGVIITNPHDPNIAPLLRGIAARIVDYTSEPAYDIALAGEHNQANAKAAAAAARAAYPLITEAAIGSALQEFVGTWRRLDYKGETATGAVVYDDYAHHPTAVRNTLAVLREKAGGGKLIVAFHPHLYSRTRDLLADFAEAFQDADEVVVAPIFAAREADDGSVSSAILARKIQEKGTPACAIDTFDEIEAALRAASSDGDIVVTMGAGDIYKVADRLVV